MSDAVSLLMLVLPITAILIIAIMTAGAWISTSIDEMKDVLKEIRGLNIPQNAVSSTQEVQSYPESKTQSIPTLAPDQIAPALKNPPKIGGGGFGTPVSG